MDDILKLKQIIDNSRNLVVLTGAGISTPSGILDFRGDDGAFKKYDFESILTYNNMINNPNEFFKVFSDALYHPNALPNKAHYYLASLEKKNKITSIITQNTDDLHQMAGSVKVYPIHGSSYRFYCTSCDMKYDHKLLDVSKPNYCMCGGLIRPDVTLYQEIMDETYYHLAQTSCQIADCLIVIGTSLRVSSVTNLLNYYNGFHLVIINKTKTPYDKFAELIIRDDIINVINKLEKIGG